VVIPTGGWNPPASHRSARRHLSEHPDIAAVFASTMLLGVGALKAFHEDSIAIPEQPWRDSSQYWRIQVSGSFTHQIDTAMLTSAALLEFLDRHSDASSTNGSVRDRHGSDTSG